MSILKGRTAKLTTLGIVLLGVATTGCIRGREPHDPKAGDVVRPLKPGNFAPGTPGKFTTVSIYEYVPGTSWVTTGKRIRFRVDHSLVAESSRREGPMTVVRLNFNKDGIRPANTVQSKYAIGASLRSVDRGGNLAPANISLARAGIPTVSILEPEALEALPDRVCGLDAFRLVVPDLRERTLTPPPTGTEDAALVERFDSSMVFAAIGPDGGYDHVIGCSKTSPTCTDLTSYRGWPVRIVFHNSDLCEYASIYRKTVALFDRFLIDETDRSQGQVESRWVPATFY